MNHKYLLAGVAAAAIMAAGNAYAGAHASVEDQVKANASAIDALSKEVEALRAGSEGIRKGVKGVDVKISGQVNRAISIFSDSNNNTAITYTDNDASSSRLIIDADTTVGGITYGARMVPELESNNTFVAVDNNFDGGAAAPGGGGANDTFNLRHIYVFIRGSFGTLITGQQGEATEGILHSSFNFASLADINPEHTNGASIDGGFNNFLAFGDGGRQDAIRYDTPNFGGAKASISARETGEVTAAIRYAGKVAGVGVLAGLGWEENFGNNNIAGSMGVNLGVVAVNGAFGWRLNEGANVEDDFYYWLSLAHKGNYTDMGATSIAVDFDNNNGQRAGNLNNASFGIGLVQGLAPGTDAYASFRNFFGGDGATNNSQTALIGMRVRF